jgi:uncharacterized protein (TIGR02145 family)
MFILSFSAFSQTPESLTYSFIARDQSENLLANKEILLVVFLSENDPEGKAIYQENHRVLTDEVAMARIKIGDGNSNQDFSELVIDPENEYYLNINGVDPQSNRTLFEREVQVFILPTGIYAGSINDLADSYFFNRNVDELQALYMKDGRLFLSNGGYVKIPDFICNCNSLLLSAEKFDVSCHGQEDGQIDLSVYGGNPPFTFHWSNGSKTEDIYNLGAGEYTVYVSDIKGFTAVKKVFIEEPEPLKVKAIVNNVSKTGKHDGSIVLKLESGNPDTRFQWSNGSRSRDLKGLSPGHYKVQITTGTNCSVERQFTVKEPLGVRFTVKDVFCNGGRDGAIKASVRGGKPPYEINWSNELKGDYINRLPAGNYGVSITDAWGYTHTDTVKVNEPQPIQVMANIQHTPGEFLNEGAIDIEVNGGTPPYKFNWSNGSKTEDLKNVNSGVYSVLITDSRYCRMQQNNIVVYRTITDKRDDQEYNVIKIEDQWWMAENVNFGKQINSKQQPSRVGGIEKFCYNDKTENCDGMGGLYTWGEMMSYKRPDDGVIGTRQGVCPDGWHIPTDSEWDTLATYLEKKGVVGDQLKNFRYWRPSLQGRSISTTGFSALPAGRMDNSGNFYYIGSSTTFWSATKESSDKAWHRTLTNRSGELYRGNSHVSLRFSVRCVEDPNK